MRHPFHRSSASAWPGKWPQVFIACLPLRVFGMPNQMSAASEGGILRLAGGKPWIEPLRSAGLKAAGPHTAHVRLKAPDLSFLQMLSRPSGYIVPRDVFESLGNRFASAPVGTGCCILAEWLCGSRLRFKRNFDLRPFWAAMRFDHVWLAPPPFPASYATSPPSP